MKSTIGAYLMKGVNGKILWVDLSAKKMREESIPEKIYEDYLGGLGIATRLLFNLLPPKIDPLKPDNPLIIVPGLLVGTGLPTASKTTLVFKSPETNAFGRSVSGAYLGVALKKAGFDAIIITGKSEKPVYLFIDNDRIEIRDASNIWGKDTLETQNTLRDDLGKDFRTCAIGPAGENLLRIADIDFEDRQSARAGGGAVMGSKFLKAIAVRGTGKIEYADEALLRKEIINWNKVINESEAKKLDMKYGSAEFFEWVNKERGVFPVKNWNESMFEESFENHKGGRSPLDPYYWAPKYTERLHPCPNCTKPCGRYFFIKDGKYAGTRIEGMEYELLYSLGGDLGIDDIEVTAKLDEICDRAGVDAISAGVTLAWAIEAYEKGLLTKEDTDGIELKFGDGEIAIVAMKELVNRKGKLGELLADGVKRAVQKLGRGSEKFSIEIKGMELPAYDIRGLKGMALAEAVSVRGGCHLTGGIYAPELTGSFWKMSDIDRFSAKWKGYEVKTGEDFMTIYDTLGMCKFSRSLFWIEGLLDGVKAVCGIDHGVDEIMLIGERIYNLEKLINLREGFTRKDDYLPYRITHEPIKNGVSRGYYVKEEELQNMLNEYYLVRGWSREGVPTRMRLFELGLEKEAEELGASS